MEAWLPESGWNGKFQAVGNGGWAGSISFDAMAAALREGYATASTDTGHKSAVTPGASFALDHPEKLVDFGYRAVHETAVTAKAFIAAYYGTAAKLAYWNSCSNGGREGLMEAQRYPDDFDGIVAGAPAANWTGRALASYGSHRPFTRTMQAIFRRRNIRCCTTRCSRHATRWMECATVSWATRCAANSTRKFSSAPAADGPSCLTAPQVEAARKIYTVRDFYPGLAPGSELGWATYGGPRPFAIGNDYGRFVLAGNPNWDFHELDVASAVARAEKADNGTTNALNPRSAGLPGARRKTDSVPRLERSANSPDAQRQLLQQRIEGGRTGKQGAGFLPPVHGPRDGALQGRTRAQSVQCAGGARAMARGGRRARPDRGSPRNQQSHGHDAALVPLPSSGTIQGQAAQTMP